MTDKALELFDNETAVESAAATPADLLKIAVSQNADLDKLEKLMQLQIRWEEAEAKKAFARAMNAFKLNPPDIYKTKGVSFGQGNSKTDYRHATLDEVASLIGKAMSEHGLSFRWETSQEGSVIRVRCIVTHESGHSESVCLESESDKTGGKNSIQAIGSAVSYLERYTLLAITGLATKDQDDDGNGSSDTLITAEQIADLESLIEEVGANRAKFMSFLKVDSMEKIKAKNYANVVKALEMKRSK